MLKRLIVPIALTFAASACGGLNGKQANELDADQRTEVCEDLADYAAGKITDDDNHKFACVIVGETAAALDMTTTCEAARDACLAEPYEPTSSESDCAFAEETDCTATVGEIKDCYEAQIDKSADTLKSFDCGAASETSTELPSECDVVKEKCPSLFGG